jgi:hypothetical protein
MSIYQSKLAPSLTGESHTASSSKIGLENNHSFTDASSYLFDKIKACPLHCLPLSSDNSGANGKFN